MDLEKHKKKKGLKRKKELKDGAVKGGGDF